LPITSNGVKTYELTYIISSSITLEEADSLTKESEAFIKSKEGVVLKSQKAVAQTLAYAIKKQRSGYITVVEFQISEDKIKDIKEYLAKEVRILRHFIVVKKPVKEMKPRRIRKPLGALENKQGFTSIQSNKKAEKVDNIDLDKKLDEILSE